MTEAEHFDIQKTTLGGALRSGPLAIPPYQREYSWKRERVRKLFDDIRNAMRKPQSSYFLGTLMFTPGHPPLVIDGQQRLATTMIFLAAVRDAMSVLRHKPEAKSIHEDFLWRYERKAKEWLPRLTLNMDDREYMISRVLSWPSERDETPVGMRHSHRLIDQAANIAAERVASIMQNADSTAGKVDDLNAWVDYIDEKAVVIVLEPPTRARAFQMYTTLNDRAQRTTQADMIKSHLFEQADDRINEAMARWSNMRGTIEELGLPSTEDPLLIYLHHASTCLYGHILADDIFEMMEQNVIGRNNSLKFLDALARYASDYAAIQTTSHPKWAGYDQRLRNYVEIISHEIRMSFIRPLMLAVAARFSTRETAIAFRMFVSWVVRFLISGGSRSQGVARAFGAAAKEIIDKKITTAQQLFAAVRRVIPTDTKFHNSFCNKSLSSGRQVRFILRELEAQRRAGTSDALCAPVSDTSMLSLEHILPKNAAANGWGHFSDDERKTFAKKLGNLALLNTRDNGAIGDRPFSEKRPVIEKSKNIWLTADVLSIAAADSGRWTIEGIKKRQKAMADLAIQRWPAGPLPIKKTSG